MKIGQVDPEIICLWRYFKMRGASLYPPLYWPRWPGHAARQHWQIRSAQFFLCPGRTSGLSYHLTFGKCPINQNNLLKHWKRVLFQTAQTSTSEDNIKRSDINDLDINISITGHRRTPFFLHLPTKLILHVKLNARNDYVFVGVTLWRDFVTARFG